MEDIICHVFFNLHHSPTACAAITSYFATSRHRTRRVHFCKADETASRLGLIHLGLIVENNGCTGLENKPNPTF